MEIQVITPYWQKEAAEIINEAIDRTYQQLFEYCFSASETESQEETKQLVTELLASHRTFIHIFEMLDTRFGELINLTGDIISNNDIRFVDTAKWNEFLNKIGSTPE